MPAGIHPLWLIIVALITLALGRDYFPSEAPGLSDTGAYLLALASALALFAESLLHQLGHAVVARRHGVEIEELDLWLLGGVARMAGEPRARATSCASHLRRLPGLRQRGDPRCQPPAHLPARRRPGRPRAALAAP